MMRKRNSWWVGIGLAAGLSLGSMPASALEFLSVTQHGAIMYDAPASNAKKLFVLSQGYPVEVLNMQPGWARVRDAVGGIAWIPTSSLDKKRMLVVNVDEAAVRQKPEPGAALSFIVPRDGLVELRETLPQGWVKVRHADGGEGYARIQFFWGL